MPSTNYHVYYLLLISANCYKFEVQSEIAVTVLLEINRHMVVGDIVFCPTITIVHIAVVTVCLCKLVICLKYRQLVLAKCYSAISVFVY